MANALFFPPCFSTQKQSKHFVEHPLFTCSDRNFFMLFETKCFLFNSHTHSHSHSDPKQLRATWGSVSLPKETLACRLEQAGIEPPTFQINKWTALPLALHPPQCDFINPLTSVGRNFGPLFFILLLWFIGFLNSLMVRPSVLRCN